MEATLADMAASEADPAAELQRMLRLAESYAKLPAGTSAQLCNACEEARSQHVCHLLKNGCDVKSS